MMKNRIKKRRLNACTALPKQFVKNIKRGLAEVKAGKLSPYKFSKRRPGALRGTFKVADDFDACMTLVLDELADAATTAADQASASMDETWQFVEESNKRIQDMKDKK